MTAPRLSALTRAAAPPPDLVDGRRERSRASRARIVAAMLDLVGKGEVNPGAAQVAHAAQVGLRTVFRHFDDMDSLYQEMSQLIEAQVMPIALEPFVATQWRDRLREMAERRMRVFDAILPYRISANIKRFQSDFLMRDYRRMLRLESDTIEAVLPPHVHADRVHAQAIGVPLSFQCWRLLRHDQALEFAAARAVLLTLLEAVLASIPGD